MLNSLKIFTLFMAGGIIYAGIEVFAVGKTHVSMFAAGGFCFVLIGSLSYIKRDIPVTVRMLISALMITLVEFISGMVVNIWLNLDVWDYSTRPLNFMGQICANASATWFFLSFVGIYADDFARRKMFGEKRTPMRILP